MHLHSNPGDYIDATWWPRTSNLATELPDLITALQLRTGPISHVVYDPTAWDPTGRHLLMVDRAIQLDPYPFELFDTMYVYGTSSVIVLQVIHPSTETDPAPTATGAPIPTRIPAPQTANQNHQPRPVTEHAAMGAAADR
ncbi:hypothetical protein HGA13_12455 [Nocardia speluncae]|uniref:Uncharacterized protein n=1 Tax=Nocardia speluncae TaxID=419477 RepID=A0A846XET0_9NOCA|nr:DUF5994 family protein [Nocardia speluncae]NKY33885.1 hypothetical protein [Nocardia speluncae]